MSRPLAIRALLLLSSAAATLVALETASGWLLARRPGPPARPEEVIGGDELAALVRPDPFLVHRLAAGARTAHVRTNEWGLRGGPIDARPAEGRSRVLLLGGSVAFGYAAPDESQTLAALLAEELGPEVEVLNAGVPGYVAAQGALAWHVELHRLGAQVIVTLDGANDAHAALVAGRAGTPLYWRPAREDPSLVSLLRAWLARRVRASNLGRLVLPQPKVDRERVPRPEQVAESYLRVVTALAEAATARGARVLAVLQPTLACEDPSDLSEYERAVLAHQERLRRGQSAYTAECLEALAAGLDGARVAGLATLDARRLHGPPGETLYLDECHPSAAGRRLLARRIAASLRPLLAGR